MRYLFSWSNTILDDLSKLPLQKLDEPIIIFEDEFIIWEQKLDKDIIWIGSIDKEYAGLFIIK